MTSEDSQSQFVPSPPPIIIDIDLNIESQAATPARPRRWWKRRDVMEMFVVFVMAVLPPLLHSSVSFMETGAETSWDRHALAMYLWLIERSFIVSIPVLYIMWRSRLGWKFFGMGDRPHVADALMGAGILIFDYIMYYGLWYLFWFTFGAGWAHSMQQLPEAASAALPAATPAATGLLWILLALLAAIGNGFAEELVMRAYFIPRLEKAGVSTVAAVLITSAAFGAYHIYQGIGAALLIVLTGVILGWVFVQTRRLWPVFFAHMFLDLIPFLFWS